MIQLQNIIQMLERALRSTHALANVQAIIIIIRERESLYLKAHLSYPRHVLSNLSFSFPPSPLHSSPSPIPLLLGTHAIVLFQHSRFRGRMLTLYGSNSNLPKLNFNDQLSSFIVTGGRWTLYEHTDYRGSKVTYGPGQYSSLPVGVKNDHISSIKNAYVYGFIE